MNNDHWILPKTIFVATTKWGLFQNMKKNMLKTGIKKNHHKNKVLLAGAHTLLAPPLDGLSPGAIRTAWVIFGMQIDQ